MCRQSRKLERDEALVELTKRYFTSRGPATLKDFTVWSGLTMADVKRGIEMLKPKLEHEVDRWPDLLVCSIIVPAKRTSDERTFITHL